ncbi:MAG: hypothetical protein ACKPKO_23610, partial [Candidatus Fonsibacter sp.]
TNTATLSDHATDSLTKRLNMVNAHHVLASCSVPVAPWPVTLRIDGNGCWKFTSARHKEDYAG